MKWIFIIWGVYSVRDNTNLIQTYQIQVGFGDFPF